MWYLDRTTARLEAGSLRAQLDLLQPWTGLQQLNFGGHLMPGLRLLQIHTRQGLPLQNEVIVDSYVRKNDLVVTYAQTPDRTTRPQIYWRHLTSPADALPAVELILSVQTSLLDSNPRLPVISSFPAATDVCQAERDGAAFVPLQPGQKVSDQGLYLCRFDDAPFSWVQLMHPSDLARGAMLFESNEQCVHLRCELFHEELEKGVIRRGRVRGQLVKRDDDEQLALNAYHDFLAATPPLTT